ncbi:hypothetical protein C0Q70_10177 [Pomacea canaliculata]|uniref:VWFD domain-containing protein n=1 Tax=Pomacea canaliculata TaxID=400727 RepID=A0A2T7PBW7_POMCA|nr:hypothetical protein C0Q70_10177 [Pomacea canaliculata]
MGLLQILFFAAFVPFSDAHFDYNWTDTDSGLFGDPHIRAFSGARGTILLPCRFHASELTSTVNKTTCTTEIFAFGRVFGRGVYTGGVEIHLNIVSLRDPVPHHWTMKFVLKKGCLSSGGNTCQWGKSSVIRLGPCILNWTFHQSFVMLQAPVCGLKLVYRLNDNPPGVIISAQSRRIITVNGYRNYVFCGNNNDTSRMYVDDAKSLKLDDVNQALAYRTLSSNLTQQILIPSLTADLHPNAGHCSTAITSFASCSPLARLKAIKTCLDIFRMRSLLRCFVKRGETYPISGSKLTGAMSLTMKQPCLKDKGKLE